MVLVLTITVQKSTAFIVSLKDPQAARKCNKFPAIPNKVYLNGSIKVTAGEEIVAYFVSNPCDRDIIGFPRHSGQGGRGIPSSRLM